LQESLGVGVVIIKVLEGLLWGWLFVSKDAMGRYGGIVIGWNSRTMLKTNSWSFVSGLGMELLSQDLNKSLLFLNIYGPYQDKKVLWDSFLQKSFMKRESCIVGGI